MGINMETPIRILHVLGGTNLGGAESRTMDLYRHMDKSMVQFDFLVHTDKEGYFDKEIEELGGHIYRVSRFRVICPLQKRPGFLLPLPMREVPE